VPQKAIGTSANSAVSPIHEAQISVIIIHARHRDFWSMIIPRGAKLEEFRHVTVKRYREFVPDRGGVPDVMRQSAAAEGCS
jgi:hypothetical protein